MTDTYYPNITSSNLIPFRAIKENIDEDQTYLMRSECPYDVEIKAFLQNMMISPLLSRQEPVNSVFLGSSTDKWEILENETMKLYEDLTNFGQSLSIDDTTEKMSFFRTAASLLEKIVSINERATGLRELHKFQEVVLDAMDASLDSGQRTAVIDKLKESIGE